MGRWEPGAAGRLHAAAMELYVAQGYEQTTVAEIAERAGVTPRTFFRHFGDKREVLFAGSEQIQHTMRAALGTAPADVSPMDAVGLALDAAAEMVGSDVRHSQRRQAVIEANAELRERELIKMATLAGVLSEGLVERGLGEREARLVAEAGIAVFRAGFEDWVRDPAGRELGSVLRESLGQLRGLVG